MFYEQFAKLGRHLVLSWRCTAHTLTTVYCLAVVDGAGGVASASATEPTNEVTSLSAVRLAAAQTRTDKCNS